MKHLDEQTEWEAQKAGRLQVKVKLDSGMIRRAWRWLFGPRTTYRPRTFAAPNPERRSR